MYSPLLALVAVRSITGIILSPRAFHLVSLILHPGLHQLALGSVPFSEIAEMDSPSRTVWRLGWVIFQLMWRPPESCLFDLLVAAAAAVAILARCEAALLSYLQVGDRGRPCDLQVGSVDGEDRYPGPIALQGQSSPAAWWCFSGGRMVGHSKTHLACFSDWRHSHGYAGVGALARAGLVREVTGPAHVLRRFLGVHAARGWVIASEALERIAALYAIGKEAGGQPREHRIADPPRASTSSSVGCSRS